jgi:hypothetical protein
MGEGQLSVRQLEASKGSHQTNLPDSQSQSDGTAALSELAIWRVRPCMELVGQSFCCPPRKGIEDAMGSLGCLDPVGPVIPCGSRLIKHLSPLPTRHSLALASVPATARAGQANATGSR